NRGACIQSQFKNVKNRIKLLLVDDHPVVRQGISFCLARAEQVTVVGEAANGAEALQKARELLPDIVLMDIEMPQMNGLAATERLQKELPQIKGLILWMQTQGEYVRRIIESGARGYVLKEAPPEELLRAIQTVYSGETCFNPQVTRLALNELVKSRAATPPQASLTNREREVLVLIAEGLQNKEIASQLGVGVRTVETHRERIMRKLNIHIKAGFNNIAHS